MMIDSLYRRPFSRQDTTLILGWPQTETEARWWAGHHTAWPMTVEAMQRWYTDPDIQPYVLTYRDALFGYGELWIDAAEQEVELARLIVAPAFRGRGVGTRLVELLLKKAENTGYPNAFLRVVPENQRALACYHRAGFIMLPQIDQHQFNQGQPLAYIWMKHPLDTLP